MGMTIDKAISHLYTYSSTMGSGQTTQAQHEESKRVAIDTMRKYQQIQKIIEYPDIQEDVLKFKAICEVVKDGNDS